MKNQKIGEYQNCSIDGFTVDDIYKLQCAFLHQGLSNIKTLEYFERVKINTCQTSKPLFLAKTNYVVTWKICSSKNQSQYRFSDSAEEYYCANKEKFVFVNFNPVNTDYKLATI